MVENAFTTPLWEGWLNIHRYPGDHKTLTRRMTGTLRPTREAADIISDFRVACIHLPQGEPTPNSRIGWVLIFCYEPTDCHALGVFETEEDAKAVRLDGEVLLRIHWIES